MDLSSKEREDKAIAIGRKYGILDRLWMGENGHFTIDMPIGEKERNALDELSLLTPQ